MRFKIVHNVSINEPTPFTQDVTAGVPEVTTNYSVYYQPADSLAGSPWAYLAYAETLELAHKAIQLYRDLKQPDVIVEDGVA